MDQQQRCIHKGMLLKRCRLSWRPRYVEIVLNPGSLATGDTYSCELVLYDQHRHMIKNRVSFDDVVTVRSCRDCIFQVFISNGKILQFRTESLDGQAHWMASLKVGLGKGKIFHVRVHTSSGLDHALLYSIGVNLPAHRVGQLDRVLVLASPINDINLNAWDLNRIKAFVESDVGIRMEVCPSCIRGGQVDRITFIMEKRFIADCMQFLLTEAKIQDTPQMENRLKIYHVPHQCGYIKQPDTPAPPLPPPYPEDVVLPPPPTQKSQPSHGSQPSQDDSQKPQPSQDEPTTEHSAPLYKNSTEFHSPKMGSIRPAYPVEYWNESTDSGSGTFTGRSRTESLFIADGTLSVTRKKTVTESDDFRLFLPPRTIPRANHESSIPAMAQPYTHYQPHLYHQGQQHFEAPYQISSRIIITDSGEVQFERSIMGSMSSKRRGSFTTKQLPVPPRGMRAPTPQQSSPRTSPVMPRKVQFSSESKVEVETSQETHVSRKGSQYANEGGQFSRSVPFSEGGQFSREGKKRATTPPPSPPLYYNFQQERHMWTRPQSPLTHQRHTSPPPSAVGTHPSSGATTQQSNSAHLLSTPPTRLTQSTSDSNLAKKATNFSITTLFNPTNGIPRSPRKRSVKRTASDSELPAYSSKGDPAHKGQLPPGNQTVASIKSLSLRRASQVSDSSDIYVIPTPPWSVSSYRESYSNIPISPSYVRETELLGEFPDHKKSSHMFSELPNEMDNTFLSDDQDSEDDDGYENSEYLRKTNRTSRASQSSSEYEDVLNVKQQLEIKTNQSGGLSVTTGNTTSVYHCLADINITNSSTTEVSINGTRGDHIAENPSASKSPKPQPRQRKPVPQPRRRSTLSSTSSEVSGTRWNPPDTAVGGGEGNGESKRQETKSEGVGAGSWEFKKDTPSSGLTSSSTPPTPRKSQSPSRTRVTFAKEQATHYLNTPVSAIKKSQSLPRQKPPVPIPRRTKPHEETNVVAMSHLSTSDGDMRETLSHSLDLKDSCYGSVSTHTIIFNGCEVGVTDL